jgi:hypothetical protein
MTVASTYKERDQQRGARCLQASWDGCAIHTVFGQCRKQETYLAPPFEPSAAQYSSLDITFRRGSAGLLGAFSGPRLEAACCASKRALACAILGAAMIQAKNRSLEKWSAKISLLCIFPCKRLQPCSRHAMRGIRRAFLAVTQVSAAFKSCKVQRAHVRVSARVGGAQTCGSRALCL